MSAKDSFVILVPKSAGANLTATAQDPERGG